MALITVIVPVYNTEKLLVRCIDSILSQTFRDFDLVLVDDGSTDDCPAICDRYARMDPKVHVIHQENCGSSTARNTGLEWVLAHSCSKYLSFVDCDDWVHPQYLELLYSAIQREGSGVAVGWFIKTCEETVSFEYRDSCVTQIHPFDLYYKSIVSFIVCWGKLFRCSDFENLRFPAGKLPDDESTIWKIMFRYEQVALIDLPIYVYYQRPDSLIHAPWSEAKLGWVDALEEQKSWAYQQGDSKLTAFIAKRLAVLLCQHMRMMESSNADWKQICGGRRRLQKLLWNERAFFPLRENFNLYLTAWPTIFKSSYAVLCLLRKIKTLLSGR